MSANDGSFADIHPGRQGVVTLSGYGINVRVDRGHLLVEDGIGADRQRARFPRVGHGLNRLVIIGSDGMVSLSALRWLADQKAAFVMLERDGSVLATTGPVYPSDARLRRAQALACQSGLALYIARELIDKKLAGQERVARYTLLATQTANAISRYRVELKDAESPEQIRLIEAGCRVPSPLPSSTSTVPSKPKRSLLQLLLLPHQFATITSGFPSPFRSATATDVAAVPPES
jgi:CRISPR/Cas system-associated endonuclease Cas1